MRLPDGLAPQQTTPQGQRRVGEIIKRQQQRSREMAAAGQQQHDPAEHQANRQAADIAEKQFCDRTIEWRESDGGTKQRKRDQHRLRWPRADRAEQCRARRDRHHLGDCHPVDAVHEIDQVDEPDAAQQQQRALHRAGKLRHNAEVSRQRGNVKRLPVPPAAIRARRHPLPTSRLDATPRATSE